MLVLRLADGTFYRVRQQNIVGRGARENVIRSIYAEGGLRGFYRGLGPVVSTIVPKVAVRFTAFHQLRAATERALGASNFGTSLLAGLGAGAVEAVVVVTPSEVVKIRQQEKGNRNRSQIATLRVLLQENGVRALYRGVGATIMRQSGQQGCKFAFFYWIKDRLKLEGSSGDLIGGALANCVGAVLNTPLDVVKTRIQRQKPDSVRYHGVFQSFGLILKEEGLGAFSRGLWPRLMRIGPAGAVQFFVFERVVRIFANEPKP